MRTLLMSALLIAGTLSVTPAPAQTGAEEISRGRLVAIAADCAACHARADGSSPYGGGMPLETPMGVIYARNITPDVDTGIGGWSFKDFDRALRRGYSKSVGHLYPAMPYTNYRYMTDEDMRALYDFFTNEVEPVSYSVPETKLGFPFIRPAMIGWNALFLNSNKPERLKNADETVLRGQYLVDVLGHCGDCHTPRGSMYQSRSATRHLSGAGIGGWYAPNITPGQGGIGDWAEGDLTTFLKTGRTAHAVAGGDMGLAIRRSLSQLPDQDIAAIEAYLKVVRPVRTAADAPILSTVAPVDLAQVEPLIDSFEQSMDTGTTDGAALYVAACATCHGIDGSLKNGDGPSLVENDAIRAAQPDNLVEAITRGIDPGSLVTGSLMPSFKGDLNSAQIGAIASYVRSRFGGISTEITASEVEKIQSGTVDVPWLIANARLLAWAGIALVLLAISTGVFFLVHKPARGKA